MRIRNSVLTYGLVARCLHWAVALPIFALFGLGIYMSRLTVQSEIQVDRKITVFSIHKTLGLTVLVLSVLRIVWAITQTRPRPLISHRPIEVLTAQTVHWILYAMILVVPLTGWLHHSATQGLAPIWGPFPQRLGFVPQTEAAERFWSWAHVVTAWSLGGVLALHIAGALKHALLDWDGTWRRMVGTSTREVSGRRDGHWPKALAGILIATLGAIVVLTGPSPEAQTDTGPQTREESPAGNWTVDLDQSHLSIDVTQDGKPIEGSIGDWNASIHYDPASPQTARLSVDIDVTSLDLGAVSQQAHSPSFLNSSKFPSAHFHAEGFDPLGNGQFETHGHFELLGKRLPLTLRFALDLRDNVAVASGAAEILRHEYGIGSGNPLVGPLVSVRFGIRATRREE